MARCPDLASICRRENAAKVTGKCIKQAKAEIENTVLKTGQFQFLRVSDLARQEVAAWAISSIVTCTSCWSPLCFLVRHGQLANSFDKPKYVHLAHAPKQFPYGASRAKSGIHKAGTTLGTVNDDVLALFDPTFKRMDFCNIIRNSDWLD
jgi:hypothetical protein